MRYMAWKVDDGIVEGSEQLEGWRSLGTLHAGRLPATGMLRGLEKKRNDVLHGMIAYLGTRFPSVDDLSGCGQASCWVIRV